MLSKNHYKTLNDFTSNAALLNQYGLLDSAHLSDLKRFSDSNVRASKLSTYVNFPLKELDLREFASAGSGKHYGEEDGSRSAGCEGGELGVDLTVFVRPCRACCVQPVRRVQPHRKHLGRPLHSLLQALRAGGVVLLQRHQVLFTLPHVLCYQIGWTPRVTSFWLDKGVAARWNV